METNKTNKQYIRYVISLIVLILFWYLIITIIKKESFDVIILIMFISLIFMTCFIIFGIIYSTILKYRKKNDSYIITSKRVSICNSKKEYESYDISQIQFIQISKEKNNYGDITLGFYSNNVFEQIKNNISIFGVKDVRKVVSYIKSINENISISDDKIIIFGKKNIIKFKINNCI